MLSLRRMLMLSFIALLTCSGCSNKEAKLKNDLKSFGLAYVSFQDENEKDPANWDELKAFAEKSNLFPDAIQRLRDGGYEVAWGIKPGPKGAGETVLAKPASGSGPVLMLDGGLPEE